MAMKYYQEFRRQLTEAGRDLTIATIFSFAPNEEDPEDGLPEEGFETEGLDKPSRDFLDSAIQDYMLCSTPTLTPLLMGSRTTTRTFPLG